MSGVFNNNNNVCINYHSIFQNNPFAEVGVLYNSIWESLFLTKLLLTPKNLSFECFRV
jgi:hypothetical protein